MGTRIWHHLKSQLQVLWIFDRITALILLMTDCFGRLSDWHLPCWKYWIVSHVLVCQVELFLDHISTLSGIMLPGPVFKQKAWKGCHLSHPCCKSQPESRLKVLCGCYWAAAFTSWSSSSIIWVMCLFSFVAKYFTCRRIVLCLGQFMPNVA